MHFVKFGSKIVIHDVLSIAWTPCRKESQFKLTNVMSVHIKKRKCDNILEFDKKICDKGNVVSPTNIQS